jgi:hypothetical protein
MTSMIEFLEHQGIPEESYILLDAAPSPRNLRYRDLLRTSDATLHHSASSDSLLPDAVVESAGQPVLYLLRQDRLGDDASSNHLLADLLRTLACRADARFLAVTRPGRVVIYPIEISIGKPEALKSLDNAESNYVLRDFLSGAEWGSREQDKRGRAGKQWLDQFLLQLLNGAAEEIREGIPADMLDNESVLSLIGRALFSRFLADRGIVTDADASVIAPGATSIEGLYETPGRAVDTFNWLDETFNGDLLHLVDDKDYARLFGSLGDRAHQVCKILTDIQYRAVRGQLELGWRGLRFKHIPVDVLSQVYENFSHKYLPEKADADSIHYTPRYLAEILIDGTFAALPGERRHSAQVLDPAVGAGVFLVLALRRLVQELWIKTGRQPERIEIRNILTEQLCGLDINSGALKITALSLYLAAIELDPSPQPLGELRFEKLFGKVLHCVDESAFAGQSDKHLGSLASRLSTKLAGKRAILNSFDIVIGNPPWTSVSGTAGHPLEGIVREIVREKGLDPGKKSEKLVRYQVPDQAFLWRAMQWAKAGGAIGFLLDGALLFQPESQRLRSLLFQAVRVTGILNGAALRQTNVWPSVAAQFCLLVARNEAPASSDAFYYLSPTREAILNERSAFRMDPHAAVPVPVSLVDSAPSIFKTLFRGTSLDVEFIRRIESPPRVTLRDFLSDLGLKMEVGYIRGKEENRIRDASFLRGLKEFTGRNDMQYIVNHRRLDDWSFEPPLLQWPRSRDTYRAPLLLFRKAAKLDVSNRGALISYDDVAFSESFYGVSLANCADGESIAEYLFVLSYSSFFVYYPLLTSSKLGVERETYHKEDYENCPVVAWSDLSVEQRKKAKSLSKEIVQGATPWQAVDNFVADVYGFTKADRQLVDDALLFELPHLEAQSFACSKPSDSDIDQYLTALQRMFRPYGGGRGKSVIVERAAEFDSESWRFFRISLDSKAPKKRVETTVSSSAGLVGLNNAKPVHGLSAIADLISEPFWSSQVRIQSGSKTWLIGQLAQRRYWSRTKARMLALEWIESGLTGIA